MTTKIRKKRKAVWRICPWCERRGLDPPFRSGKGKTLAKHSVACEAEYILQQGKTESPTEIATLTQIVLTLQRQVAGLTGRVHSLEERRVRLPSKESGWQMSPKQAWDNRKRNTVRAIRACLSQFVENSYCKTPIQHLEWWLVRSDCDISDILSIALWPVIDLREDQACLRDIQTDDMYCIFKQIWGKSRVPDLDFWYEAFEEVGLPVEFFNRPYMHKLNLEFQRIVRRFQSEKHRVGSQATQGTVGLVRHWRKVYQLPKSVTEACKCLPPTQALKWGTSKSADPTPSESVEAHTEGTIGQGLQSRNGTRSGSDATG